MEQTEKFELSAYEKPKDLTKFSEIHVAFSGVLQKHPYDAEKIILVSDPFGGNLYYYEFQTKDISYIEELPNLVSIRGKSVAMTRVWIKKKSVGIRSTPFIVEDMRKYGDLAYYDINTHN
ncbi:MAG: inorganic pyrophosphatase Ppa [Gammaproteobacteria bacterium]|nr:inorganic pyrophosphatase Ppa [Gammaproteobacteria bacterium]